MPYTKLKDGFNAGKMLLIEGKVKHNSSRIIFDVLNADHKVAFHMHVRFDEKVSANHVFKINGVIHIFYKGYCVE